MRIVIGFSTTKKKRIGSELIKFWINKPYSHVYIRYLDSQQRDLVWHASHGVVHTVLKDNFDKDNTIIKEVKISVTEEEYNLIRDFCFYYAGTQYSYIELIHIVIYDLLKKVGIPFFTPDSYGFICSELVSLMLKNVFNLEIPKPSWLMRPDDCERLVEK